MPITSDVKSIYVEWLVNFSRMAVDPQSPVRETAGNLMRELMWRWTADTMIDGVAKKDSIKTNPNFVPATIAATHELLENPKTKLLRHEHVVPLKFLSSYIIKKQMRREDISDLMEKYCKAVIVHLSEDRLLTAAGYRSAMPAGWKFGDDCYARYRNTFLPNGLSLFECILPLE